MKTRSIVCALVAVAVLTGCGSGSASDKALEEVAPTGGMAETSADDTSTGRCVEQYSGATLRERAFAFDGTVVSVASVQDPRAPKDDIVAGQVEFQVHEWFSPRGPGDLVKVWMQRSVEPGDRLLVAGEPRWGGEPLDDAIAHECEFTASYSDALRAEWSTAFATDG